MGSTLRRHALQALLPGFTLLVVVFLFMPIVVVVLFSFNASSGLSFPIEGLSLRWYENLFSDPTYVAALEDSAQVALAAAAITAIVGTMAAFGLTFVPGRRRALLAALFFAPIALPGLFVGLSLLVLFAELEVTLSLVTVTAAHVLFTLPFFILVARAALDRFDPAYLELAADLGAAPVERFRRVTLPMVGPILVAGTALTFALSFDEFIITSFVIGPSNTVPLVVWSSMHRSIDPSVNALASLLLTVTVVLALLGLVLFAALRRRSRKEIAA
jgi:spermidine/putrescine transport system permease protein